MARNSESNSCLEINVGGSPTQKVNSCQDPWGRRTQRRVRWTPWQGWRCCRSLGSVDHSSRSFKRSFKARNKERSLGLREIVFANSFEIKSFRTRTFWFRLRLKSFKTRTFWLWSFRTFWLRLNRGEVVVDNSVVDGGMVDDERSGFPETIRLIVTKNFKTQCFWFGFWLWFRFRIFRLRLYRGEVAVGDSVNAVVVVDDDQSGSPETIRLDNELHPWGSNYCIQRKYNIE